MPDAGIPSKPTSVQSPTVPLTAAETTAPLAPPTQAKTPEELANELYTLTAKLLSERTPRADAGNMMGLPRHRTIPRGARR